MRNEKAGKTPLIPLFLYVPGIYELLALIHGNLYNTGFSRMHNIPKNCIVRESYIIS